MRIPDGADALAHANEIHRRYAPEKWGEHIEHIPAELREEARQYLRGLYKRYLLVRKIKRDK